MSRLARQNRVRRARSARPPLLAPAAIESDLAADRALPAEDSAEALRRAKTLYLIRRHRDRAFGPTAVVFRDPAWDMLLDLFAARIEGRKISISSAAVAACIPQTTAIRLVDQLIDRNLLRRTADTDDGRRTLLELTPMAVDMMWRFLSSIGDEPGLVRGAELGVPERGN